MNSILIILTTAMFLFVGGCSTTPPKFVKTGHAPYLDENGGVLVLIDACVKRSNAFEDDFVIIAETKAVSKALESTVRNYLVANGITVRATLIPFSCGALHTKENSLQKIANNINGSVKNGKQPFDVADLIRGDGEYINSLSILATYAFQQPILEIQRLERLESLNEFSQGGLFLEDEYDDKLKPFFGVEQFNKAAAIVADRSQASSILYIGQSGLTRSTGQSITEGIGSFIATMAIAVATGGLVYLSVFSVDSSYISATLINLENHEVPWSKSIRFKGDPVNSEILASYENMSLLLSPIVRIPTPEWSYPGNPPELIR